MAINPDVYGQASTHPAQPTLSKQARYSGSKIAQVCCPPMPVWHSSFDISQRLAPQSSQPFGNQSVDDIFTPNKIPTEHGDFALASDISELSPRVPFNNPKQPLRVSKSRSSYTVVHDVQETVKKLTNCFPSRSQCEFLPQAYLKGVQPMISVVNIAKVVEDVMQIERGLHFAASSYALLYAVLYCGSLCYPKSTIIAKYPVEGRQHLSRHLLDCVDESLTASGFPRIVDASSLAAFSFPISAVSRLPRSRKL